MRPKTYRLTDLLAGFYISKQAEGCSPKTLADYRCGFKHLAAWADANGKTDPTKLSPQDVKTWLSHIRTLPNGRGGTLSPKTCYNCYMAARSFYRWLNEELGVANPMLTISTPKVQSALIEPLTREQVDLVLKACDATREAKTVGRRAFTMGKDTASRDRALVMTLLDSGLRSAEACALRVQDLDMPTGRILVYKGKGSKPRIAYVGKIARKTIWRYLSQREDVRPEDPLFATRQGRPFSPDRLTKLFSRLGERAGVPGLHPHRLRHTFATQALKNGASVLALQQLLGHSSLGMTARYARIAEVDLATAHEANSPGDRWHL